MAGGACELEFSACRSCVVGWALFDCGFIVSDTACHLQQSDGGGSCCGVRVQWWFNFVV
jgi:hypothetical protein